MKVRSLRKPWRSRTAVVLPGPAGVAGKQAFPILAGYIFGKNKGERTFAMTAQVTQTVEPVRLDMTAPVTQAATGGRLIVQFVRPKGVTAASAPEPEDARVQVRDVPPDQEDEVILSMPDRSAPPTAPGPWRPRRPGSSAVPT